MQPPLRNGLVLLSGQWPIPEDWRSVPDPQQDLPNGGKLKFVFQDADGKRRTIEVQGFGKLRRTLRPDGRVKTSTVASSKLHIRIQIGRGLTLSCGDVLFVSLPESPGMLVSIEAEGPFARTQIEERESWRGLEVREPLVRRLDNSVQNSVPKMKALLNSVRRVAGQDRLILSSGDEIHGVVREVSTAVEIGEAEGGSGVRRISRDQVSAVCFTRPDSRRFRSVTGVYARIDLVPDDSCSLGGVEERFWIRTAMTAVVKEGLHTQHPLLGMTTVHWPMIRRITPLFAGSYQLLDPGPRHLGNGFRESFNRVEPDGTELSLSFELDKQQLAMPTFLSADIAELIPSGVGTLKATPFLDEVRNGFLATQVLVNGEVVGPLNRLINLRSSVADPERVRMPLPARLLKAGENLIQIRQTSAKDDPTSFDDCELRAIAIEIEHRQ